LRFKEYVPCSLGSSPVNIEACDGTVDPAVETQSSNSREFAAHFSRKGVVGFP
jgi:hypothetical protein